jgi:hypothetical protein
MIKIRPKIELKPIEKFFLEKSMELLNKRTIDTNRLKLNNPLSTIKELMNVCNDLNKGKLKNHDYALSMAKESIKMLNNKHYIISSTIDIEYFKDLINKIKKDNYTKIVHAGNFLLRDNNGYLNNLFENVFDFINTRQSVSNLDFEEMREFSRLIEYLFVELNNHGYSKFYLHRFMTAVFSGLDSINFEERFAIIKSLKDRKEEVFEVIFGLDTTKFDKTKIKIFSNDLKVLNKSDKKRISVVSQGGADIFLEEHKDHFLLSIKVKTKDYYQALNYSRKKLLHILDVLYLGYSDKNLSLISECFILGSHQPEKSSSFPTMYHLDGYYKSNHNLYKELLAKLSSLKSSEINIETINKINSGIRYLRMGGESGELINKFINYWIGLEYLFSTYDAEAYTVGRLREYFKRCHALIYIKRNMNKFHKDIYRLKENEIIINYNDNLEYLKLEKTYDDIILNSKSPLLKFRAHYYKELLNDSNKVRGALENHQKNLEWNLTRIYRIRNEIVHNAAIKEDIAVLTSHLRYYLTFIINGIIDFLINHPKDINNDDLINIDDYFLLQDLSLSSLEKKGVDFKDLIKINNPLELII